MFVFDILLIGEITTIVHTGQIYSRRSSKYIHELNDKNILSYYHYKKNGLNMHMYEKLHAFDNFDKKCTWLIKVKTIYKIIIYVIC